MNESLRRALAALQLGADDLRTLTDRSPAEIRERLRETAEEILSRLEDESVDEPEDIFSALDRQSRSIAEDLRRADRLMRERTRGTDDR
jgi:hypothetical protein